MFDLREDVGRFADDLARRARPLAKDLAARARPYAEDLYRRAHGALPVPASEERSFLSGAGGQVAGAAALGVLAGLAFGVARKAAVQGAEALAGDWMEILKAEHRAVEALFEALLETTDRQKIKRAVLLHRISAALAKHAAQEEMVIYPALKESFSDSQAMHLYEGHARVKIFIHELHEIAKDDPLWIERARTFHEALMQHVREEEDEIFPLYHARMSPQQNKRLTLMVHKEGLKLA